MKSAETMIRFEMESAKSEFGPVYNLTAKIEEDAKSLWNCQLKTKQSQSKMELSVEVTPSKINKTFSGEKIPTFYFDIYQSRLQPARRNETAQRLRVDLMLISRTSLPYAEFRNLGRTNVVQEDVASWLTNMVSESLQKILKTGFSEKAEQRAPINIKSKAVKNKKVAAPADDSAEEEWPQIEEPDTDAKGLGLE